ncbi:MULTISPECIES: MarR family transcriptional regulator [unclassified Microbacterium]|jgi:DNA-binding MarR family transcriptional regulator|uniref:MarR family winged helix-turn-helix transcriptional regulator n=1 Tax=unclassified Microbacterium TaxID=2609290 RepID=UPI00300FD5DA
MTAEHAPRILYQVKQVELAVRGRLDDVVRPHGITVTQYTALTVLEQHPGMSSSQLARHAFVTAQAMEGIVRALVDAGLIDRVRDPENRRRMAISLTPAGVALLSACRDDVDRIEAVAFGGRSGSERAALGRWLQEARRALEQSTEPVD